MSLPLVLGVATALFGIGLYGLLQRRSLVAMLIALELMLAAISINVVALTTYCTPCGRVGDLVGPGNGSCGELWADLSCMVYSITKGIREMRLWMAC